jgi:hypothetical protein
MGQPVEVPIPHKTALELIKDGLKPGVNQDTVADFLMETMDKESAAMMIMLLQLKTPYEPILPGDYVTFHYKLAWFTDNKDIDVMVDLGLSVNDHYFARIPEKDEYGNKLKSFSPRVQIEFMTYDDDKKLIYKTERVDRHAIEVVTPDSIPMLKFELDHINFKDNETTI